MLVWGTYNYSFSYLASFPSSCIVHNYDAMIIQVYYWLVFYYNYTCTCIDKSMQIVLERGSIDRSATTHFSY